MDEGTKLCVVRPDFSTCEVVSLCCEAEEHKWFPLMCSNDSCCKFVDFKCIYCEKIRYKIET